MPNISLVVVIYHHLFLLSINYTETIYYIISMWILHAKYPTQYK